MASFVENTQHKVERKAFEIMANSIVGKLTKTDDIAKRQETFLGLIDKAETFWGNGADKATLDKVREYVKNPENRWVKFVNRVLDETNPNYAKKFLLNLGYEAFFRGTKTIRANREKYNCNIPWLILFDPTDACNMHCVGCWSGTYSHKNNMSYEDMDKIVTQGKELGTYLYFMTGGEPTVRKNDILKLAEKHNDCMFGLFSNSTLIDEELCKKIVELGNITFLLSIEGTPETNDGRRGDGHYAAVMKAMDHKRLTDLTEKLVFLSRMDEENTRLEMEEFSLSEALLDTIHPFSSVAKAKGKTLTYDIISDINYYGDEKNIRQLISILLDNALKYSNENGEISIKLYTLGKNKIITVWNSVENISSGKHDELFDRFYRLDESRNSQTGGFGIGLSVAYAIVKAHKGTIKAKSDDEKSILFTITL